MGDRGEHPPEAHPAHTLFLGYVVGGEGQRYEELKWPLIHRRDAQRKSDRLGEGREGKDGETQREYPGQLSTSGCGNQGVTERVFSVPEKHN